jgi:hypothetical protein
VDGALVLGLCGIAKGRGYDERQQHSPFPFVFLNLTWNAEESSGNALAVAVTKETKRRKET